MKIFLEPLYSKASSHRVALRCSFATFTPCKHYLMQQAGARAAIASLWSVSDGGTQALMHAFYTALENGYTKAEALRLAQQALITGDFSAIGESRGNARAVVHDMRTELLPDVSNNLSHPYYWAPFILIGNGL